MSKKKGSEDLIAGFERLSFVESISSRFEVPPRLVVYGLGGALAILIAVACWMNFSGGELPFAGSPESQTHSALERPPTEFYNAEPTPVADTPHASVP